MVSEKNSVQSSMTILRFVAKYVLLYWQVKIIKFEVFEIF